MRRMHRRIGWLEAQAQRYPEEIKAAVEDFKLRFDNFVNQLSQNQRSARKRKRIHAYLTQVFGHHNGMWDYVLTGGNATTVLNGHVPPLHERVLETYCAYHSLAEETHGKQC